MAEPSQVARAELTYSEEIILRCIADGMRDPEIAVRLGVTVGDVKRRVEQLMRRAGAGSREELGRRDPNSVEEEEGEEEPLAAEKGRRRPPIVASLAAAVMVAVAAGALSLFLLSDRSSTEKKDDEAEQSPAPQLVSGFPVTRLRFIPAGEYPDDLLLYVLRDCPSCTAPVALDRIYRNEAGGVVNEAIFRADTISGRYILSVWARRDASDIVVAVCDAGSCGGRRPLTDDAATRIYRSRDGGVTWEDVGAVEGVAEVVSAGGNGMVLVRLEEEGVVTYRAVGAGGEEASELIAPGPPPEFVLIPQLDQATVQGLARVVTNANGVFAYSWYPEATSPDIEGVATRIGIANRFGQTAKVFEYIGAPLELGVWADSYTVTATVAMAPGVELTEAPHGQPPRMHMPVVIDIQRGTVAAMPDPFTNTRYMQAINRVVAAVRGMFLRVGSHQSGCLPLYAAPRRDAVQRACLAEGTLVTFIESRLVVSEEWRAFATPTGSTGWARPEDADVVALAR